MTEQHPITPPPELLDKWLDEWRQDDVTGPQVEHVALQAARWGADQELEACCEWLKAKEWIHPEFSDELRAARRPKPSSHKELALIALTALEACASQSSDTTESVFYIRRALEQLDD